MQRLEVDLKVAVYLYLKLM